LLDDDRADRAVREAVDDAQASFLGDELDVAVADDGVVGMGERRSRDAPGRQQQEGTERREVGVLSRPRTRCICGRR
jgi:hypothetical protein